MDKNAANVPENLPEVILVQPEVTDGTSLLPAADNRSNLTARRLTMAAKASWIVGLSCMFLLPAYTSLVWPHYIISGILVIGILALAAVGIAIVAGVGCLFAERRWWIVVHSCVGLVVGVLAVAAALLCGAVLYVGEEWQAAQLKWNQRGDLSFAEFLREKFRTVIAERKAREEMSMLIAVPAPGLDAAQVDKVVADPIEREMRTLEDFESVEHVSRRGECRFRLDFKAGGNHSPAFVTSRIMTVLPQILGRQRQWSCSAKCSKPSEVPTDWESAISDPDWPSRDHDNANGP
jgi:hypothetical protein